MDFTKVTAAVGYIVGYFDTIVLMKSVATPSRRYQRIPIPASDTKYRTISMINHTPP